MRRILINLLWLLLPALSFSQTSSTFLTQKANLFSGLSFKFSSDYTDDKNVLVYKIYDQSVAKLDINLDQGYFIKDDFALGVLINFALDRKIGTEQSSQNIFSDIKSETISWSVYASMKNYFALDTGKRFNVFNQIKFGGTIANTLTEKVSNEILDRAYTERKSIGIHLFPGMLVRIAGGFAIEGGIEIAGFKYEWSDTEINKVQSTSQSSFSGDFTIDLLKIGVGFYFFY